MDLFGYFEKMKDALLEGVVVVMAGSGQYDSGEIARVLREQKATVLFLSDSASGSGDHAVSFLDEQAVAGFMEKTAKRYGALDVLITNLSNGKAQSFEDTTSFDLENMWVEQVKKVFVLCNNAGRIMKAQKKGKIINIVSSSAKRAYLGAGVPDCSSAAAVVGLTRAYAEQLAPFGVTANCIAAGMIEGEALVDGRKFEELEPELPIKWQPVRRLGQCADIAHAAAFLSSYLTDYITGYNMDVNGGFVMD